MTPDEKLTFIVDLAIVSWPVTKYVVFGGLLWAGMHWFKKLERQEPRVVWPEIVLPMQGPPTRQQAESDDTMRAIYAEMTPKQYWFDA